MKFCSIIPAGGSGTRLWPVSNSKNPKFLYDLLGRGQSLIQETYSRLSEFSDDIFVVCGGAHKQQIEAQLPELKHTIVEPSPKNSMGAIGVATYVIAKQYGEQTIVGSFAADQIVEGRFKKTIKSALETVKQGYIATIGIVATTKSTAYGYIKSSGKTIGEAIIVDEFVEKPDEQTADHYIKTGSYFWNAGMFIFKAHILMEAVQQLNPKMHELFLEISDLIIKGKDFSKPWSKLEAIAIDYQIAEPCSKRQQMVVVPANFKWSDIGDWNSVSEYLGAENLKGDIDDVAEIGSTNVYIYNKNKSKKISLVGMHNVSVINTDKEILIVKNKSAQRVKNIVELRNKPKEIKK